MKSGNYIALCCFLILSLMEIAHARFLGAEISPENPLPEMDFSIVVFDDPFCNPYIVDNNGISHELNISNNTIDLYLAYGGVCSLPSDTVNEHTFEVNGLPDGIYNIRVYENTADIFPTDPEDRVLLYEDIFIVGEAPQVIPAITQYGLLIFVISIICIAMIRSKLSKDNSW